MSSRFLRARRKCAQIHWAVGSRSIVPAAGRNWTDCTEFRPRLYFVLRSRAPILRDAIPRRTVMVSHASEYFENIRRTLFCTWRSDDRITGYYIIILSTPPPFPAAGSSQNFRGPQKDSQYEKIRLLFISKWFRFDFSCSILNIWEKPGKKRKYLHNNNSCYFDFVFLLYLC